MKKIKTIAIILLVTLLAVAESNSQTKNSNKLEKEKIIQTISSIFIGADERNWQKVQIAMAKNVLLDYTSMVGGNPATQKPQQITDAWAAFLPG